MATFNAKKAVEVQKILSKKIVERDMFIFPPRNVAGVDLAYVDEYAIGVAVLMDFDGLHVIETAVSAHKVDVPYIPTLLAFREIPAMAKAIKRLRTRPDVILVDAHGKIHPRKFGAASHLGVILGIPTIGVAKSPLFGSEFDGGKIVDGREILGVKLSKNIYVSIGHMVSLDTAIKIVEKMRLYRLPEPLRRAHKAAERIKNEIKTHKISIEDIISGRVRSVNL